MNLLAMETPATPEERPTPYRISTITFNGDLNVYIQGSCFYDYVNLVPVGESQGFVWMECWVQGEQQIRGVFPKRKVQSKRSNKKPEKTEKPRNKSFDNQISMYYWFQTGYIPHVKLFKNGNIHITGLRNTDDGHTILEHTKGEIERIYHSITNTILQKPENIDKLMVSNPVIRLINSDFHIPFKIRRKELHQLLIEAPYHNICSFQPGTYPGVKLEYYWNCNNEKKDGCCRCLKPCFGKATGKNTNECKKVTVAIFDSGSILITGATTHRQVEDAYQYICQVIFTHKEYLKKVPPKVLEPATVKE